MKAAIDFNNFARGQSDRDLIGRNDLPVYRTSAEVIKNFITNFKGSAIYRTGWERLFEFEDCSLHEFSFSETQNYILVFYNTKLRFLTYDGSGNFGWVLSGASPLEVTTPYSLAQSKELQLARHEDVTYICHPSFEPRKLTRTGASTFTLATFVRNSDPFASPTLTVSDTSTSSIAIGTGSKTFTVTAAKGYLPNQPITITKDSTNYMKGTVTSYSGTTLIVNITFIAGTGTHTSWAIAMTSNGYPACVAFYGARLFYAATDTRITTVFGSVAGSYDDFTIPSTIDDDDALIFTVADLSERIQWLVAGENSLMAGARDAIVAINGGQVGDKITADSVAAKITSVDGVSKVMPIRKDGDILYIGKNYRNTYYFSYNILTEAFEAPDANIASFDVTKSGFVKMRWKKDRDDIVYLQRNDGKIATLNFMKKENIIGWHEHETLGTGDDEIKDICLISDNDGDPFLFGLIERDGTYYIERLSAFKEFSKREYFYTGDEEADDEAWYRKVSDELLDCIYLDSATVYSNLKSTTITYNAGAGTITSSGAVFSAGNVGNHIVYKTATGYESGRFEITGYTSSTVVSVEVLDTPTANTYASWYLTFSTVTGLTDYEGLTVSLVSDGGYFDDQEVVSGEVTYSHQVSVAVIGFGYRGLIKSFPLGFLAGTKSTFVTEKSVVSAHVTTLNSWGGKFGSSQYHLQDMQRLTDKDMNYLPSYPMNGTFKVDYNDDAEVDKAVFFIQDTPAPFQMARATVEANYAA